MPMITLYVIRIRGAEAGDENRDDEFLYANLALGKPIVIAEENPSMFSSSALCLFLCGCRCPEPSTLRARARETTPGRGSAQDRQDKNHFPQSGMRGTVLQAGECVSPLRSSAKDMRPKTVPLTHLPAPPPSATHTPPHLPITAEGSTWLRVI